MTATREAIVLPAILLTVTLLGGLRIAGTVRLVPPPLTALVLGVTLLGALVRAGALAPDRLMSVRRSPMENVSGTIVVLTLFAASAQVFNLLTPERGLLHVVFGLCFFVQLATTVAGVTGRTNLLRSLLVLFGAAFVVRFIVLESLYAADGGLLKRLLTTLLEGASLGAIDYQPNASATGYVAFFALALYMIALTLLPPAVRRARPGMHALRPTSRTELTLLAIAIALTTVACGEPAAAGNTPAADGKAAVRDEALRAARVWQPPSVPIPLVDFAENPPAANGFQSSDEVACRFVVQKMGGTTPKFYCQLADGRIVKVKYGAGNPETHAEVAATRLLEALGFGADRMFVVRTVRCAGCPRLPFPALKCYARTGIERICFAGGIDYAGVTTFDSVVIEQRMAGSVIEGYEDQGWAWFELDRIDPAAGGSPRADVDALRLFALLIAHWDNKGANQRLVCPPGRERPDGRCSMPLAIVQDAGATFGPLKIELQNWRSTPVWTDRATCTVGMSAMPYQGATFPERRISEQGRLKLAGLLEQISEPQLVDLFTGSGFVVYDQITAEARDPLAWARAFQDKVRQIKDGPACPN